MRQRVLFPKGYQQEFLEEILSQLNLTWEEFANKLDVNVITLSKTYRFGISRLPYDLFVTISNLVEINHRAFLIKYNGKITNGGVINPRKTLGENRKRLSEVNITYSNKNNILNIKNIFFSNSDKQKNVKLPTKITQLLAEEVGMHLGDGYLSDKKNEFRLKGNKKDEKEYYNKFVSKLYKKLFNLKINLKEYDSTYGFEIYSKAIYDFKITVLGIQPGRKDNICIPECFKLNNVSILTSLLRGLFDTDGNIYFQSRYGYKYYYPCISIGQKSEKLINDIFVILKMLGFNPSLYFNRDFGSISLYGYTSLKRYLELIGFNNPKHLKKIYKWKALHPKLYGDCSVIWQHRGHQFGLNVDCQ